MKRNLIVLFMMVGLLLINVTGDLQVGIEDPNIPSVRIGGTPEGSVDCSDITGGSDADYCADASGGGNSTKEIRDAINNSNERYHIRVINVSEQVNSRLWCFDPPTCSRRIVDNGSAIITVAG